MKLVSSYTPPPKKQKISVFLMFSRGIERDQWYEMCQSIKLSHSKLPNCAFQLRLIIIINRSSHRRCSVKKTVLNNFAIFTRKHLCLIKLRAFWSATLLKKRLWHRCFLVKLAKFLRTSILKNMCKRLLLHQSTLKHVKVSKK